MTAAALARIAVASDSAASLIAAGVSSMLRFFASFITNLRVSVRTSGSTSVSSRTSSALLNLFADAQGVDQVAVRGIGILFLADDDLDRARTHERGHADANRVGIPAVADSTEVFEHAGAGDFFVALRLLGRQEDANGVDERAMHVDLARLVEQLQRGEVLGRVRFAGQHVLDRLLFVDDPDGNFIESG